MKKTLPFVALVVLTIAVACSEQMTVEEYAKACGEVADSLELDLFLENPDDFSGAIELLEESMEKLEDLDPPEELERFHRLRLAGYELSLEILDEFGDAQDGDDTDTAVQRAMVMMAALQGLQEGLIDLQREVIEEQEGLPSETKDALSSSGCVTVS